MSNGTGRIDEALGVIGRLVVFAVVSLAVLFVAGILLKPVLPEGLPPGSPGRAILLILASVSLFVGQTVTIAALERSRWSLFGLDRGRQHPAWLVGAPLLGTIAVLLPAAAFLVTGRLTVLLEPPATDSAFAATILLVVAGCVFDALLWRGLVFGLIADRATPTVAVVMTVVGATLVAGWPREGMGLVIAANASLALCLAVVRWRAGFFAALLAHVAFALTADHLVRAPAVSADLVIPAWRTVPGEPAWLTGGERGIVAGAGVALTLAVISFLVVRVLGRHAPGTTDRRSAVAFPFSQHRA